jgi:hypothetical protein
VIENLISSLFVDSCGVGGWQVKEQSKAGHEQEVGLDKHCHTSPPHFTSLWPSAVGVKQIETITRINRQTRNDTLCTWNRYLNLRHERQFTAK